MKLMIPFALLLSGDGVMSGISATVGALNTVIARFMIPTTIIMETIENLAYGISAKATAATGTPPPEDKGSSVRIVSMSCHSSPPQSMAEV